MMPSPYAPSPLAAGIRRLLRVAPRLELPLAPDYRPVAPLDLDEPEEVRYAQVRQERERLTAAANEFGA